MVDYLRYMPEDVLYTIYKAYFTNHVLHEMAIHIATKEILLSTRDQPWICPVIPFNRTITWEDMVTQINSMRAW